MSNEEQPARSLIFSAAMVKRLLAGEKTQTRRLLGYPKATLAKHGEQWAKWLAKGADGVERWVSDPSLTMWLPFGDAGMQNGATEAKGPPLVERLQPGARVWVREAFAYEGENGAARVVYRADLPFAEIRKRSWKSPRFMRREHSRITLEITNIRIERLQDLTEEDAIAEGIPPNAAGTFYVSDEDVDLAEFDSARTAYFFGWDGINGKRANHATNPWVRAIGFKVLR